MRLYARITKIDETERMVFGYASTEALDSQGEVVKREALEAALPDYMRFANIREMHQPSAVGVATEAGMDERGLFLAARIVDPVAWEKVVGGVYKGFSIGGRVVARDEAQKHVITGLKLSEISLVDRPANPEAVFTMYKSMDWGAADGEGDELGKIGARNSKADLARIQAIHDAAAELGAECPGGACADDGDGDDDNSGDDAGDDRGDDAGRGKLDRTGRTLAKLEGRLSAALGRIAKLEADRTALERALAARSAERPALRAVEKSADRAGPRHEPPTKDPLELARRALRQPLSLIEIEKLANR